MARTVFITGAAGHLGRAVAAAFAAEGANLVLVDRTRAKLGAVFGGEAPSRVLLGCDLLDGAQVQAAADRAIEQFGGIDVLCNIAGGFRMGEAVHETSDATWDALFDLNGRRVAYRPARGTKSLFGSDGRWCGTVADTGGGVAFGMTQACAGRFFH